MIKNISGGRKSYKDLKLDAQKSSQIYGQISPNEVYKQFLRDEKTEEK